MLKFQSVAVAASVQFVCREGHLAGSDSENPCSEDVSQRNGAGSCAAGNAESLPSATIGCNCSRGLWLAEGLFGDKWPCHPRDRTAGGWKTRASTFPKSLKSELKSPKNNETFLVRMLSDIFLSSPAGWLTTIVRHSSANCQTDPELF